MPRGACSMVLGTGTGPLGFHKFPHYTYMVGTQWRGAFNLKYVQLFCLVAALAPALSAGSVVFGNIGCSYAGADTASCINEASAGSDPIDSTDGEGPIYDSFTSGTAGQIDDLQLILGLCDSCSPLGSFGVGLYADNSGTPGAEIGPVLAIVNDSSLSTTAAIYDITLSTPVAADTVYWIGLSGATTDAE